MNEIAKCERCREYNAAAVDFRRQAANVQNDYAVLLARHNALAEECDNLKDHNQYLEACLEDRNAEMMRHVRMYETLREALREAVAWERDCNDASEVIYDDDGAKYDGEIEFENILYAARAEVDRLLFEDE